MDEKNIKVENNPPLSNVLVSLLNKKKPLIILIVLLLIITIALLAVMFKSAQLKQGSKTPEQNTTVSPSVATKTINEKKYKEIIKESIAYIESQRRPDGFYEYVAHYDEQCTLKDGKKDCPFGGTRMFETTNAWTALAHFAAYKALGDKSELEKANRDLAKLIDWCAPDPKKCLWVLAQPAIIYQDTKDPKILNFLKPQGLALLSSAPSTDTMLVAIESRELALLYEIFQDSKFLSASNNRLSLASRGLNDQQNIYINTPIKFAEYSCWVALANGELSVATKNAEKKNNTLVFLENGKILQNFSNFYNPIQIQPCIETYSLIGSDVEAKNLLDKFILGFYDGKKEKLIYGEGGTVFQQKNNSKMIVLTDSAYTIFLLSNIYK